MPKTYRQGGHEAIGKVENYKGIKGKERDDRVILSKS